MKLLLLFIFTILLATVPSSAQTSFFWTEEQDICADLVIVNAEDVAFRDKSSPNSPVIKLVDIKSRFLLI